MVNHKRGLTDTKSFPTMEIPGRQITSLKIWSKQKTPAESRWANQQTRSFGHNQLKGIVSSRCAITQSDTRSIGVQLKKAA